MFVGDVMITFNEASEFFNHFFTKPSVGRRTYWVLKEVHGYIYAEFLYMHVMKFF